VFHALVRPLLAALAGEVATQRIAHAVLAQAAPSNHGREELLPVRLCAGYAEPVSLKSGLISPLTRADGYIRIPRDTEGLVQGASVEVILF
jgi:molybdopterin biosynthesis enzyme